MARPSVVNIKNPKHRQRYVSKLHKKSQDKVKVSISMIVCNEEEYIEYALKSIYDFAYEIIIVEGAVKLFMHAANADGSSIDNTMEIIKKFPDPRGKIRILRGKWKNKAEMKLAAWKQMTGDYYMIVDADEIYVRDDLMQLRQSILEHPTAVWFSFPHIHFWQDFKTITTGGVWDTKHPRLCRRLPHFTYNVENKYGHTTIFDTKLNHFILPHKNYDTIDVDILCYHYGYVKKISSVNNKEKFYEKRRGTEDFSWRDWQPGQPTKNNGKASSFAGKHPEVMRTHPYHFFSAQEIMTSDREFTSQQEKKEIKVVKQDKSITVDGHILQKASADQLNRIAKRAIKERYRKRPSIVRYNPKNISVRGEHDMYIGNIQFPQRGIKPQKNVKQFVVSDLPRGEKVSLVIIHFGDSKVTQQSVTDIIAKTTYRNYDIILIDNDATSTNNIFADTLIKKGGPHIQILNNNQNQGFAYACNQGAKASNSRYVCIMNNDLLVKNPNWLQAMIDTIEQIDNVGMVGCKLIYDEDHPTVREGKSIAGTIQHAGVVFRDDTTDVATYHLHRYVDAEAPEVNETIEVPAVTGACILYDRKTYLELGGYDEVFGYGYCEDIDMALKMRETGRKIMYVPEAALYHYESKALPYLERSKHQTQRTANQAILNKKWSNSPLLAIKPIKRKRIGIITTWRPQGIGYIAQDYLRVLRQKYDVYIMSRKSDIDASEWQMNNLTFMKRDHPIFCLEWAQENKLDLVISCEINSWAPIRALYQNDIPVVGFFVSDTTRLYCVDIARETLKGIITPTQHGARVHAKHNFNDVVLPYYHPFDWSVAKHIKKRRFGQGTHKDPIIFFHNAGWGGWDKRKNTTAVIEAYNSLGAGYRSKSKLLIHVQNEIEGYGKRANMLVRANPAIIIHEGTISKEEILQMTADADICVLPSKWEGLGMPFIESFMCGTPVITVDAPPMNELVRPEYNGLLARCVQQPRQKLSGWITQEAVVKTNMLASQMRRVIDDPNLVKKMSKGAKDYALTYYEEEKTKREFLELISRFV